MLLAGGRDEFHTAADGWTLRTNDGSLVAQFEHTVVVTAGEPLVLTASAAAAA
jgi:methionyl aminopeptidase